MNYKINEITRTVQGEGYFTGWPCVLVRLQGCNLNCSFCDTPGAISQEGGQSYTPQGLAEAIKAEMIADNDIILLTGGEPLLQDLEPLYKALGSPRFHVETNGTNPIPPFITWSTVSPKTEAMHKMYPQNMNEIKWLVSSPKDIATLHEMSQLFAEGVVVNVQPISQDEKATALCYQAALDYGWRLSLQTHKFIGVK